MGNTGTSVQRFLFCEPFVQKVVADIIERGFENLLIFPLLVVDSAFTGKIAVEQVNEVIAANAENSPFTAIRYIPAFAIEPTYIDLLVVCGINNPTILK